MLHKKQIVKKFTNAKAVIPYSVVSLMLTWDQSTLSELGISESEPNCNTKIFLTEAYMFGGRLLYP